MRTSHGGLRLAPDVVSRRLGEGAVLVHLPTNRIFELNETGARVWELLTDGATVDHVVRQLALEFAVDETEAGARVSELVARLSSEGLVDA